MHIVLIIFGALLLLFGGGCTLVVLAVGFSGSSGLVDILNNWVLVLFGCILPLAAGYWMVKTGVQIDREKRRAKSPAADSTSDKQNWPE